MSPEIFLEQFIDGYLFSDLTQMATLRPLSSGMGAAGYPMVGTIISGMSLLGMLARDDYDRINSETGFKHYWDAYLSPMDPKYSAVNADIIHKLARNGIAHTSLAGVGITITKNNSHHIEHHKDGINIDSLRFTEDFKITYLREYKPSALNPGLFKDILQRNIGKFFEASIGAANSAFAIPSASSTSQLITTTTSGTRLTTTLMPTANDKE